MAQITAFATRAALMAHAAERIADSLREGLAANGRACAALSGGATPEPAYALLAQQNLDWPNVTFALVDERFVPPTHAASNEAMLRRALAPALEKGARLAPMYSPGDVEAAARAADAIYAPLAIDVALMGMGEDGHTASWFAGARGLDEALDPANARAVAALHAPQAAGSAARLSLTRAALARAGRVLLAITGDAKRAALEAALQDGAPVAILFAPPAPAPEVFWAP